MKAVLHAVVLSLFFFLWVERLDANEIQTPFGSVPSKFEYKLAVGEVRKVTIEQITTINNGQEQSIISVTIDTGNPVTIPQNVINYLQSLESSGGGVYQSLPVHAFMALIIINHETGGQYQPFNQVMDTADGRSPALKSQFNMVIPSCIEDGWSLNAIIPLTGVCHTSWLLSISGPFSMQFIVNDLPSEPDENDSQNGQASGCCSAICNKIKQFRGY